MELTVDVSFHIRDSVRKFLVVFYIFFSVEGLSQILKGQIVDTSKKLVEGAYVLHLASEHHAHSDESGNFILAGVEDGDSIQVIHVGYEVQSIVLTDIEKPLVIQLTEKIFQLDEVIVGNNINSLNSLTTIDLKTNPVNSSQQILRKIPGLFIGQHAGGGKAEQIFLRGFDIDHGTDINITVDGLPVNMVSHSHGQGYADLHFLIPEIIEKIDFGKGPYNATKGNFATAGYMDFKTKDRLENNIIKAEVGRFNTIRTVGLFDLLNIDGQSAYVAVEYLLTDGPFESPQNLNRLNMSGKYRIQLANRDNISLQVSHFTSKWDASGQIPTRAVSQSSISRWGSIDDTEGGSTDRTNINLDYLKVVNDRTFVRNKVYISNYDFELFSNFTFFLNDPVDGDQIRQKGKRVIFGFESEVNHSLEMISSDVHIQAGIGLRYDDINGNELSRTRNRRITLENVQLGNIDETNLYTYLNGEFEFGNWLINPALRLDIFKFDYVDQLDSVFNTQSASKAALSPKLNVLYNLHRNLQLFAKSGFGFHSNDTRVILQESGEEILPVAIGFDIGTMWKPIPRMIFNVTFWHLFLEQEFVYVGGEGIVELSGRSRRQGFDFSIRYQINDWLFFDSDINYAIPRSIDAPEGQRIYSPRSIIYNH